MTQGSVGRKFGTKVEQKRTKKAINAEVTHDSSHNMKSCDVYVICWMVFFPFQTGSLRNQSKMFGKFGKIKYFNGFCRVDLFDQSQHATKCFKKMWLDEKIKRRLLFMSNIVSKHFKNDLIVLQKCFVIAFEIIDVKNWTKIQNLIRS